MQTISRALRACWDALLLRDRAYKEMRDGPDPAIRGVVVVLVVAVLVSVALLVGEGLRWSISPSLSELSAAVLNNLQRMPWYRELSDDPAFVQGFRRFWQLAWQVLPRFFGAPDMPGALIGFLIRPLVYFFAWLALGILAHAIARLLGGQGSPSQTLGCLGLAVAPQLFSLFRILPQVRPGSLIGVWTLLCGYMAIKAAHGLSWERALGATLLILLVVAGFLLVLAGFGLAVTLLILSQGGLS